MTARADFVAAYKLGGGHISPAYEKLLAAQVAKEVQILARDPVCSLWCGLHFVHYMLTRLS